MSEINYYEAPSDEIFDEIKKESINIWKTYDDTYGYSSGKISRIKDLQNIKDNGMYMVSMFDWNNRIKLLSNISLEAEKFVKERI